ncbi:MAG: DnaE [Clostridiales bacterium]|nr:DnaE [Clostridiales bacterium]
MGVNITENGFVHLHVHSEYSLLDGYAKITLAVKEAKEKGMPALSITDHGVMYGTIDFYKECKKNEIKPIIGCEVYVARRSRFHKEGKRDDNSFHLVLLAENNQGYKNLLKLVSAGFTEGFYYKPRVDLELLEKHSEGLIALSACLAGEIPQLIIQERLEEAYQKASQYKDIFGENNFYLELQDHGLSEQRKVNRVLVEMSKKLGIPLVATNDVHYTKKEDAKIHDVLLCIQTGKTLQDEERMKFATSEFYLKSADEMRLLFGEIPDALTNTVKIAERCNVEFDFGELHLPDYQVPEGYDKQSYLEKLCHDGLKKRYSKITPEIKERLQHELRIIKQMGYPGYFLIVWDLVNFARKKGILVGPGRGSAAGSLVAYVLGITNIDPLKYDLLFERFLNPERVTMPDIDIDFCFERRGEVIEYLSKKYGSDRVSQIITFGTMAAKAAVRDVGRVLGIPLGEVDKVAKLIPNELGITISRALEMSIELKELYESDYRIKELLDMARSLEGTPRHASTHAAGVVIAKEELTNYLPLQKASDGPITTQFPMTTVEEIGLLKMDILGLRTLTVIGYVFDLIRKNWGVDLNIDDIPLDDPKTFALLASGNSMGVFQLESEGMRNILKNLKAEKFEDIIAMVALYRPGPLGSGMVDDFIQRKHGKKKISYLHPALEPILADTYGVILYQEQVMKIASELSGFTLGEADLLRRAMGKKKPEIIAGMRKQFINGAVENNVDAEVAGKIFDLMEYFAGYGFNKSHSAAYALVAYLTAYLKAHYPVEFMAALLTSIMNNPDKVPVYIEECKRMGIEILPPDVNESNVDFTVWKDKIRFGLAAVKNVGTGAIKTIISARQEKGKFTSLEDFCEKVDLSVVNKRVMESLIKCGAFNSLGIRRSQAMIILDTVLELGQRRQAELKQGQMSLFDMIGNREDMGWYIEIPDIEEYSSSQILAMEKETLGFYISGHPITSYEANLRSQVSHNLEEITPEIDGRIVTVGGVINRLRRSVTKKGEAMAYMTIEDLTGSMDILVFPRVYSQYVHLLKEDSVVLLKGRVSYRDEELKIFAEKIKLLDEDDGRKVVIVVSDSCDSDQLAGIKKAVSEFPGSVPVYIQFPKLKKAVVVNKKFWVDISGDILSSLEKLQGVKKVSIISGA